jgi:hypothetical protein
VGSVPANGQKKRPVPERLRHARCPACLYFAYLVKKFNLKILVTLLPGALRPGFPEFDEGETRKEDKPGQTGPKTPVFAPAVTPMPLSL